MSTIEIVCVNFKSIIFIIAKWKKPSVVYCKTLSLNFLLIQQWTLIDYLWVKFHPFFQMKQYENTCVSKPSIYTPVDQFYKGQKPVISYTVSTHSCRPMALIQVSDILRSQQIKIQSFKFNLSMHIFWTKWCVNINELNFFSKYS